MAGLTKMKGHRALRKVAEWVSGSKQSRIEPQAVPDGCVDQDEGQHNIEKVAGGSHNKKVRN